MVKLSLVIVGLALALLAPPALTQSAPAPVPIEAWSLEKVAAMGREIHIQDRAAWVATDALLEALNDEEEATVRGWVVVGEGADRTVRFVKANGDGVQPGWDIPVRDGQAGEVRPATDAVLPPLQEAAFRARQTAGANPGRLRCAQTMNSVVADDPDSDGWLVWLLASTTEADTLRVGGHYRYRISADGRTMQRRDQLSNGCLDLPRNPPPGPGGQPGVLLVTQIVSDGPVETHVFLSLQNRVALYVSAQDKLFAVSGDRIRTVDLER